MAEAQARALILGRREEHSKAKREADDGASWQHVTKAHAAATEYDVGHDPAAPCTSLWEFAG
jgi:hypothetical protein